MTGVLHILAPSPFGDQGAPADIEIAATLSRPIDLLLEALPAATLEAAAQQYGWTSNQANEVQLVLEELDALRSSGQFPLEVTRLRSAVQSLTRFPGANEEGSPLTAAVDEARELLRLLSLIDALRLSSSLVELEEQTRNLRDILLAGERAEEQLREVILATLVERAIGQLRPYADSRRIDIRYKNRAPRVAARLRQTDIQRALTALVSNAIKYSYTLEGEQRAWLDISVGANSSEVWTKIESWGVPITAKELESGSIFQPGQRGQHALTSGRIGGGIGLWDAKRVATSHGGDIELSSRPTQKRPGPRMPPHLTTAILHLPLNRKSPQRASPHKPVNSGQERQGALHRRDEGWIVKFEGDNRPATVVNSIPASDSLAEGTKVITLVTHQSKKEGIRVRVLRIID